MDGITIGFLGAVFGTVLGCVGTGYGMHASIQNADTPARKELIRKTAFYGSAALFVFMFIVVAALAGKLPDWVLATVTVAWFVLLGPAVFLVNRGYAKLGEPESA